MKLPELDSKNEPNFKVGDCVWTIQGKRVNAAKIVSIIFELCGAGADKPPVLIYTNYRLDTYNFDNDKFDTLFPPYRVYATKAEVEKLAKWHAVNNISEKEWKKALGNRDDESSLDTCEFQRCCANIADIRSLLYKCQKNGGLIERDVQNIRDGLKGHGHQMSKRKETPIFNKIAEKLGLF